MKNIILVISALVLAAACSSLGAGSERVQTLNDLKERVTLLKTAVPQSEAAKLAKDIENQLLGSNTLDLSKEEVSALQFLYAYMPVNDMAENSFEFFVNITKQAFLTKGLPWGETVTPELFKYYVLPPRINNETLDDARQEFYNELYPRVKDKSMYDAVIEVNHWCREKIVYQPTDGRTTQPTNTVARAYGRCGEESTVTVTALRSVGIPARQVYVPRWAHTNSNHAWVEVWVDGTWYYLGACEPEPLLDRGWFTASASRAMLVNSYAHGPLKPSDNSQIKGEIISQSALFTEVSSTATYTPVKKAVVQVVDKAGKPLEGASVSFSIINGNSLASMADRVTDEQGIAYLTTGLGTFVVETFFAKDNATLYAARLLSVKDVDTLKVVLEKDERKGNEDGTPAVADFAITPPPETRFPKALSEEMQKEHEARCALDDSIRLAHTATFLFNNPDKAKEFSAQMVQKGLPKDMEETLTNLLLQTLSGGDQVARFLNSTDSQYLKLAVQLLQVIRVKDIQEISAATYQDYLNGVTRLGDVYQDTPEFVQSVLNPRFSNEIPIAYKDLLWNVLTQNGMNSPGPQKETLAAINKTLDQVVLVSTEEQNPRNFYMTPSSIASFGMADAANYTVFARALLSTAGIPSRSQGFGGPLQIFVEGEWKQFDVKSITPSQAGGTQAEQAKLTILDPEGRSNGRRYVLQRWSGNGYRSTGGFGMPAARNSNNTVEAGYYRILTSIRAADGSMLARIMTFEVKPNSEQTLTAQWYPLTEEDLVVIGSMDAEWKYTAKDAVADTPPTSILNTVGRNFFVLAYLEPTKEPSQHFIRELSSIGESIKMPILVMFSDKDKMDFYFKQNYKVSEKIHYGFDSEQVILNGLGRSLSATDLMARMPVVVVADSFGNIYYQSIGYNIGVPETISKLNLPIHITE